MIERNNRCPQCDYNILARVDNNIYCLNPGCVWTTPVRREEDRQLPEIHELRSMWGEA